MEELRAGREVPPPVNDSTLQTDFTFLTERVPDVVKDPAWEPFKHALKNRAYGGDALLSAWTWFKTGWTAHDYDNWKRDQVAWP